MAATKIEYNCIPNFIGLPIPVTGPAAAIAFVRVDSIAAVLPHHNGNPEHCNVFLQGDSQPMVVHTSVDDVMHGIEVRGR